MRSSRTLLCFQFRHRTLHLKHFWELVISWGLQYKRLRFVQLCIPRIFSFCSSFSLSFYCAIRFEWEMPKGTRGNMQRYRLRTTQDRSKVTFLCLFFELDQRLDHVSSQMKVIQNLYEHVLKHGVYFALSIRTFGSTVLLGKAQELFCTEVCTAHWWPALRVEHAFSSFMGRRRTS